MKLLIDAGNTNIVYGITDGQKILRKWRTSYRINFTKDEFAFSLLQFLNHFHVKIDAVNISCVVPEILSALKSAFTDYFQVNPKIIDWSTETKLIWDMENPSELGSDRIANCVAAYELYGPDSDLIVIDFGTATTYDLVDRTGKFVSGITAPGLKISADALFNKASLLSKIDLFLPDTIFVRNTVDSLRAGIVFSHIGSCEYIIKKLKDRYADSKVIATGGLCSLIETEMIDVKDCDLTLKGLMLI